MNKMNVNFCQLYKWKIQILLKHTFNNKIFFRGVHKKV